MEYNDGTRDRDSFDPYDGDRGGDGYAGSAPDRGEAPYGRQDYGRSSYGRSPYAQSPYNGESYGDYGGYGDDMNRSGRIPRTRGDENVSEDYGGDRGDYARGGDYDGRYGRDARGYDRDARDYDGDARGYGRDARDYDSAARDDRGYGRDARDYDSAARDDRGYGRDARDYDSAARDDRGYGRDARDYDSAARDDRGYGRDARDYDSAARDDRGYGRMDRTDYGTGPDADDLSATGRRRIARDYEQEETTDGSRFENESYDDEPEEPRSPKKKKKRSKFSRFMRGLGAYIAQLPTQTLVLFGGIVAVVLVGVILLVILLPKGPKQADIPDNGQLSIADITPTPSLAPTIVPPDTTPEPTATPIVDPFNGSFIKTIGEENDVIPAVQERLVELGYMDMPEGGYTKRYGTATKNGIRMFQIKNYEDSSDWDGCLGLGTYTLLLSEEAKPFYLARGDGDSRTQEISALVDAVKKLQARLVELGYLGSGSDTGVFGSGTAAAVKTFQQYHGLLADGWAGQSTLTMLYSDAAMTAAVGQVSPYTPTPDPNGAAPADAAVDPNAAATTADPNAAPAVVDPNAAAPADGTVVES